MDKWRGLRELLVAATLGIGLLWACAADAAVMHAGHLGHPHRVHVTDTPAIQPEPAAAPMADTGPRSSEGVGTGPPSEGDDGTACAQGHCLWCTAVPARACDAAVPPPVREGARAAAHMRPGRCTAPETPPPIA
jgi:hypothetical protein